MNAQALTNNSKIRVRQSGFISPVTRRPIFRIEDQQGQVLRRISSARNPDEAVAHYWRSAGSDAKFGVAMPDQPSDASLRRRIAAARTGRVPGTAGRVAMQTHELALPELELPTPPDVNETLPEDIATSVPVRAAAAPKRRALKSKSEPQAEDLFQPLQPKVAPEAIEPTEAEPTVAEAAEPEADLPEPEAPEPEPAPASAVEEPKPEPTPEPIPEPEPEPEPEPDVLAPYHLDPQTVMLQQVDHRNLRPNDRTDSYLYHVTNRAEAKVALDNGLVVSAQDPVILTERPGVAYWLSVLAEDFDFILDGPADFVVLRMRRFAVETLLEPDPHASRSAGCACYLLTGGPAQDRQG